MLKQQSAAKNHTSPWKPVTKDELMAMNIAMGIVSLPKLDQYQLVAEEQQVEGEQQHMEVVLDQLVTVNGSGRAHQPPLPLQLHSQVIFLVLVE